MIIAFFVNDMEREFAGYTTTVLAYEAHSRGHGVCYVTPDDFLLTADDRLHVHGRFLPKAKFKSRRHEINVSTYQMCVLLLFNTEDTLSYAQISDATAIPVGDLKRALQSLACAKFKVGVRVTVTVTVT
mgnify:CR=1 FL=1